MLDKKYYNLNELHSLFQISIADISYAIEQTDLWFVFLQPSRKYLVGTLSNRKFVCIGSAMYEGLIRLDKNTSLQLLKQQNIAVDRTLLLDMESIKDWSGEYPFQCTLPNSRLNDWVAKDPGTLDCDRILAFPYPKEQKNSFKKFTDTIVSSATTLDYSDESVEKVAESNKHQADFVLNFPKIELSLQDANVLSSKLIELFPTKFNLTNNINTVTEVEKKHLLHKLILSLIKSKPTLGPASLWRYIKEEYDAESDSLDPDNILVEINKRSIIWLDGSNVEHKMQKKIFESFVSEQCKNK
jgi:hypothetical protein